MNTCIVHSDSKPRNDTSTNCRVSHGNLDRYPAVANRIFDCILYEVVSDGIFLSRSQGGRRCIHEPLPVPDCGEGRWVSADQ